MKLQGSGLNKTCRSRIGRPHPCAFLKTTAFKGLSFILNKMIDLLRVRVLLLYFKSKGETSSQQACKLDDQTKIKGKAPLSLIIRSLIYDHPHPSRNPSVVLSLSSQLDWLSACTRGFNPSGMAWVLISSLRTRSRCCRLTALLRKRLYFTGLLSVIFLILIWFTQQAMNWMLVQASVHSLPFWLVDNLD